MRINKSQVTQQVELMVGRLLRDSHLDIPMTSRSKVMKDIEGVIRNYLNELAEIEEEAQDILLENDIHNDPAAYRRAVSMITEKRDFPRGEEALRYLNRKIQAYLWDSDDIEEIYSDEPKLIQCVGTYLTAMTR